MKRVNIHDAKTQLSKYITAALAGEEVVIHRAGEPLVVLVPWARGRKNRKGGGWKGRVTIKSNFDDPLPSEMLESFGLEDD